MVMKPREYRDHTERVRTDIENIKAAAVVGMSEPLPGPGKRPPDDLSLPELLSRLAESREAALELIRECDRADWENELSHIEPVLSCAQRRVAALRLSAERYVRDLPLGFSTEHPGTYGLLLYIPETLQALERLCATYQERVAGR